MHHELYHVILIHEFLALGQCSFGLWLIRVRPSEFSFFNLLAALIADLALEIMEISLVGLDSTLASKSFSSRRLVGEFRFIFTDWLSHLVPGADILPIGDLRRILQNKGCFGKAISIFWLL